MTDADFEQQEQEQLKRALDAFDHGRACAGHYQTIENAARRQTVIAPQLKTWKVRVSNDFGESNDYLISASSKLDAFQIAFALDGGWNELFRDALSLSDLAAAHCSLV